MPRPEPSSVIEVEREEHEIERSSHALYGLVIITATLVAEREAATDAVTSLVVLWGAGVVLLLAHLYAAAVAQAGEHGRWLSHAEQHFLIADNIPVLAAHFLEQQATAGVATARRLSGDAERLLIRYD